MLGTTVNTKKNANYLNKLKGNDMKNFTLNMAKSRLSVGYTKNNSQFVDFWENQQTYQKANASLSQKSNLSTYVLLDGPPYANGPLHLGHALNKNLKDLVVKSRWFNGQPVSFQPGWDCHGLPLELAVEKTHGRQEPAQLKQLCKELALTSVENHKKGFKSLGVLADWENPYLTLNPENLSGNWKTLADLMDKDLLVYKQFPVHYCPACASSLASAELEMKELSKSSLYFTMPVNSKVYQNLSVLVWTTTPWTLPMNQGVAFNADFNYEVWFSSQNHSHLVLQKSDTPEVQAYLESNGYALLSDGVQVSQLEMTEAVSPLTQKQVPLLSASFVEEGKTGFVHMALSHGPEDFELGVQHGLLPHSYLNKFGKFETANTENLQFLDGVHKDEAAQLVVNKLSEYGLLVSHATSMQEQNVCWRHKKGVYFNATWQVFLNLEAPHFHLKNKVKALLSQSELTEQDKEQLGHMLFSREHWCLSRQRNWGCEMNLLVDKSTNALSPLSSKYLTLLATNQGDLAQELLNQNPHLFVFKDVLDVWFDSGNVVNTYSELHGDQSDKFVVNMALEGKDQYRGWFQAMMWLCVAKKEKLPYQHLFCHGFVLNKSKEKFSKSSGNAKGLEYYLEKFGADTLHLWVASQEAGKDAVFSEENLSSMETLYSRLRLCLRFLSSNLYDYNYQDHSKNWERFHSLESFDLGRYMLSEMHKLALLFKENFNNYHFKTPLNELYEFCSKTLSNFFFDYSKNPLYLRKLASEERLQLQCVMFELFNGLLDMVKVYAPFVAEEFYQDFFNNNQSVFEEFYFSDEKMNTLQSLKVLFNWSDVMFARKMVLGGLDMLQKDKTVKSRTEVKAVLTLENSLYRNLLRVSEHYRFKDLFNVSEATLAFGENHVSFDVLTQNADYQKCPRCWNYEPVTSFDDQNLCSHCHDDEV